MVKNKVGIYAHILILSIISQRMLILDKNIIMINSALQGYLFIGIIALLIWALILSWIIASANETKRRDKIQLQNQQLLALIAEKLGGDINQINSITAKK